MYNPINNLYEGVDTISVKLSNAFLNQSLLQTLYFSKVQHINRVTYVHNICDGLSLSRTECFIKNCERMIYHYYLDIQADYIYKLLWTDRYVSSCNQVVYRAVGELVCRKIIIIPEYYFIPSHFFNRFNNITNLDMIRLAFHIRKVCKLTELDFFFDFDSWKDVKPFITANRIGKTTFYSIDHGDFKSQIIIYDRHERLKAKNQVALKKIAEIKPVRLEFRLNMKTCNYLDLSFLCGNIYALFYRYSPILIKSWKKYCIASVKKDLNHPLFDYIQTAVECGQVPKISNELMKAS